MSTTGAIAARRRALRLSDVPLAIWMLLAALAIGFASGARASELIATFNEGWGRAIGDFALILLPSFTLAAALTRRSPAAATTSAAGLAPVAAAAMVCPDTAYAALAPVAGRRRLSAAFGSYAGFKLLFPAGPLLVATSLGATGTTVFVTALALFLPVWFTGLMWARIHAGPGGPAEIAPAAATSAVRTLAPFGVLVALIAAGIAFDFGAWPPLDFVTRPPGALMTAATLALADRPASERRECLDSGIGRTGSLLFLIGAASALGAVLVELVPVADHVTAANGTLGLLTVVGLTALFKLVQGSSMATFAAVTPLVAPFLAADGLSPDATVLAVCVGSLIAVLPNDSFYWLVRQDACASRSEREALITIAGGTVLQGLIGIAGLLLLHSLGVLG